MKIACLLADGFEDSEYADPAAAFKEAGHQVVVTGTKAGEQLKGKKGDVTATTEKSIADVKADQFDALFIPGGYSPDHIRGDRRVVDFTREFVNSDKPVFAICHGPQLLITAGVVKGPADDRMEDHPGRSAPGGGQRYRRTGRRRRPAGDVPPAGRHPRLHPRVPGTPAGSRRGPALTREGLMTPCNEQDLRGRITKLATGRGSRDNPHSSTRRGRLRPPDSASVREEPVSPS